ncbi:MAG: VPLPA-CTERM sorting domain-containing protein [Pseudomonadota bacterium]
MPHDAFQSVFGPAVIEVERAMGRSFGKALIAGLAALAFGTLANPGLSATLIIDDDGQLTGATGLDVNGTLYDVEFVNGSCRAVFADCNPDEFDFQTQTAATAASSALFQQVFRNRPANERRFNRNPELTLGCGNISLCMIRTPYGLNGNLVATSMFSNSELGSLDEVDTFNFGQGNDNNRTTYAVWTLAPIPLPATSWMLLAGLLGLLWVVRLRDFAQTRERAKSVLNLPFQGLAAALIALLLTFNSGPAFAATLTIDTDGQLTGATDIDVDGMLYDVAFVNGSCVEVFNGCDPVLFTFQSLDEARAATRALRDQVFRDRPAEEAVFNTEPELTEGCSNTEGCFIRTPYGRVGQTVQVRIFGNLDRTVLDGFETNTHQITNNNGLRTYAVWTPTPVPLPGAAWMILLGLGALAHHRYHP